ncbi:hypothetical protein Poli38472_012918 [Pythium oligandrum]|uniref:C2H2-type domain-containing protein n=1 Tax=Pythium oligandrum TaxID=41045 RepID=A0A8K1CIN4_PYTOL|nr:hypothetical protein Poli38472_012918 [Pythium oligandrum]|eukprot:TMW64296.1 hypothetical protein Poli38472_012918 [Pythium oligandrum]
MGKGRSNNAHGGGAPPKKHKRQQSKKASASAQAPAAQVRNVMKAQTNALLNLASFSNPNPKTLGPFSDRHRILIVGDGDFSFALSLAVYMGGRNITATCYDSQHDLREKYSNALVNADALETAGASVHYSVDATALEKEAWIHSVERFHSIAFNFPHLGGATEEDVEKNQELLRDFFYSTRAFLHPTQGQVLVALRNTLFYNRWDIEEQARISGFKLKRIEAFDSSIYSGYQAQRTHPASFRGEPPSTVGARYFIFSKDPSANPVDPRTSKPSSQPSTAHGKTKSKPLKGKKTQDATDSSASFNCKVCGVSFRDSKKFNGHMNSAKHARKVKQQQKKSAKA